MDVDRSLKFKSQFCQLLSVPLGRLLNLFVIQVSCLYIVDNNSIFPMKLL